LAAATISFTDMFHRIARSDCGARVDGVTM
jgi:hypothetical protein